MLIWSTTDHNASFRIPTRFNHETRANLEFAFEVSSGRSVDPGQKKVSPTGVLGYVVLVQFSWVVEVEGSRWNL